MIDLTNHPLLGKDETLEIFLTDEGDFEKQKGKNKQAQGSESSWRIKLDSWQNFLDTSRAIITTSFNRVVDPSLKAVRSFFL